MLMQDRLRTIMKASKMNASEFADHIGVNRASLSHVLSGRNKPSMDFLSKIINHFPNVNATWLLTGEAKADGIAPSTSVTQAKSVESSSKKLEKVLLFYSDGSCEEYVISRR